MSSSPTRRGYVIEPARREDLQGLPAIEAEASALFDGWNVTLPPNPGQCDDEEFAEAHAAGLLWVARSPEGELAGFALVELAEGEPHLEEIDVRPAHGRRGVGRALVEAVLAWARTAGHRQVTLTTFRDLPWNEPFYASVGFRSLEPSELTSPLEAIVRYEEEHGLARDERVVMRYDLKPVH